MPYVGEYYGLQRMRRQARGDRKQGVRDCKFKSNGLTGKLVPEPGEKPGKSAQGGRPSNMGRGAVNSRLPWGWGQSRSEGRVAGEDAGKVGRSVDPCGSVKEPCLWGVLTEKKCNLTSCGPEQTAPKYTTMAY